MRCLLEAGADKESCSQTGALHCIVQQKATMQKLHFAWWKLALTRGSAWRLELTTGSGELLAQSACCKTGRAPTSPEWSNQPAFALMRADGAHHATLQRNNEEGYELSAPDRSMFFWGSFDHHAVNITDEGGKLLATSELCSADWDPTGEFYRLRVAPLVDVGLLLCSLVCIDQVAALGRRT
ncbi:unnamed protein product [Effrenium voratum]|nr:unnamed protein product [Effrenium voratum]